MTDVYVCSVTPNSLQPHGRLPTRLLCPWNFPGKKTKWLAISSNRESSQPRIKPLSPALAGGFFPAEPPGKTKLPLNVYLQKIKKKKENWLFQFRYRIYTAFYARIKDILV